MTARVYAFVDVGNQFYCVNKRWPGRKLNYRRYMSKCRSFGEVVRAFAYGTQVNDSAFNFIMALRYFGFEPNYKQVTKDTWYSWDVGLAIDMVRLHEKADVIIIGSSNRNLAPAIQWIKEKSIRVIVIACGIPKDVKDVCDQWIEVSPNMLEPKQEVLDDEQKSADGKQEVTEAA